jgi:hypothetical protein
LRAAATKSGERPRFKRTRRELIVADRLVATTIALAPSNEAPARTTTKCVAVGMSLRRTLGINAAGAVKARGRVGVKPKATWCVAAPDGAAWAVDTKPNEKAEAVDAGQLP